MHSKKKSRIGNKMQRIAKKHKRSTTVWREKSENNAAEHFPILSVQGAAFCLYTQTHTHLVCVGKCILHKSGNHKITVLSAINNSANEHWNVLWEDSAQKVASLECCRISFCENSKGLTLAYLMNLMMANVNRRSVLCSHNRTLSEASKLTKHRR